MICKFAFLSNILLASVALSAFYWLLGVLFTHPQEDLQSQTIQSVKWPVRAADSSDMKYTNYSNNWAGAVWDKHYGTFTTVTGTFRIPRPLRNTGGVSYWVGLDGFTCGTALLQAGVDFEYTDGILHWMVWYEWWPDAAITIPYDVTVGDLIMITITATQPFRGTVVIEDMSAGWTFEKTVTSTHALCGANAEWIAEAFIKNGVQVPLGYWGTMAFTSASATGPGGVTYTPWGAMVPVIWQQGALLTFVRTWDRYVSIERIDV